MVNKYSKKNVNKGKPKRTRKMSHCIFFFFFLGKKIFCYIKNIRLDFELDDLKKKTKSRDFEE